MSQCIAYVTQVNPGDFGSCGNQYWNGGPATDWHGVGDVAVRRMDARMPPTRR